jgi:hypothetical protein
MISFLTLFIYYWVIIFSIVGYGILFNKFFYKSSENDIGFIGIYGIFFLILISYITSFFFPHTELFNLIIIIIGLINFFINKEKEMIQKNIKNLSFVFIILSVFILTSKQHDDFPYYHFPYIHLLTEYANMVGIGNFNHGFRTHSSIFYLSSLFNLPFSNLFLLHLAPVFFLGFSNLIFYNKILKNLDHKNPTYILYLSLLSLIFVNIFFYRLAEHGTDRSAMILIIVAIIELFYLTNNKQDDNIDSFLKLPILITLIISLKTFYALYALLFVPVIFIFLKKKISFTFFFKSTISYLCLILLCLVLTVNFFNSGCLLYPIKNLCFENFSWAIPLKEVEQMNLWYQQWAKAGANPNFRVENPEIYIKNFNWVSNWFNEYFFNKVSDFLLGLFVLCLIVFLLFFSKKNKKFEKPKYLLVYSIIIFLTLEWFYLLPTLRYGGYHLIAMIFFIPLSIYLSKYLIDQKVLKKKVYLLIFFGVLIFLSRNVSRLNQEYHVYNYNVFNNAYYSVGMKNFSIFQNIQNLNRCYIKKDLTSCKDSHIQVKFLNNSYIYYREKK